MTPTSTDKPSPLPEPSPIHTSGSKPSRRRRWVFGGVLFLLVLSGVCGWWFWHRMPALEPPAVPNDIRDPAVEEAVEADRRKVLEEPRSADAWGNLGMTLYAYLYHEQADRCFAEAARLDPTNACWPYYRFSIATWIDPPKALPFLQHAVQLGSSDPHEQVTLRLQLADLLLEHQQLDAAERIYREELRNQSTQPRAILGIGLVALARGNEDEAMRYLKTALASPYTQNKATVQLAILTRRRGDEAIAADYEMKAATLPADRNWPDPFMQAVFQKRVGLAQEIQDVARLERENRYEEAAAVYLHQVEREPDKARHYVGAGLNLARAGQYDRAVQLLRQSIQLDPDNCVPYYDLAKTLYRRAEEAWNRSPGSASGREWFREAASAAEQATARKPDHAEAYLIWGQSLLRGGQTAQAIAPLQKGVTCRPESFDLQLVLGETFLEMGRLKEATIHLKNAQKLHPKDPQLIEALKRLESRGTKPLSQ